ncbi:MAG: phosphoenolpyruvate--protein phosphotransferase [Spirochaetaceae bacterium]|nr:MAG: phosphoenolpyruvate--protein phosphotransferase [Spirochaetaceae bacterium]
MQEFNGISVSPGIAIGKAFLYLDETPNIPRYRVQKQDLEGEFERLGSAIERAVEELENIRSGSVSQSSDAPMFLDSHLLMLQDESFIGEIRSEVEHSRFNVEWVLRKNAQKLTSKLASSKDEYLRDRSLDIHDVAKRLLDHLMFRERISLADLSSEVILVAHDLLPSDAIAMNKRMIRGIVLDAGGKTSHTAILARSFEIPAVLGLSNITSLIRTGEELIVDGNRGHVVTKPDTKLRKRYERLQSEWQRREVHLMGLNDLPAETRDGKLIQLKANIEVPEEVEAVLSHGADGVGLYRSEFLFMRPGPLPDEDEQFSAYSMVLKSMENRPVTIRTLDLGADKIARSLGESDDDNPILGWRAIRLCLSMPELFRTQLRALYRASIYGELRIMFPMISGIEELSQALEMVESVKSDLKREKVTFREDIPVGIMIEVPSAAMTADILARKADFFSIGTNDLIQYTLAVDRGNEKIAYLYEPFHPGVLRMLRLIIESAHAKGLAVGMCGEMAGDPMSTVVLLGLGLDEFSMGAVGIPEVKRIIRSVSMAEAEELVGSILEMKSYVEIDEFVAQYMEKNFELKL